MTVSFATSTKDALDLSLCQRLKLAEVLLVSADGETEVDYQAATNSEPTSPASVCSS